MMQILKFALFTEYLRRFIDLSKNTLHTCEFNLDNFLLIFFFTKNTNWSLFSVKKKANFVAINALCNGSPKTKK
jgi:hypothetical protein